MRKVLLIAGFVVAAGAVKAQQVGIGFKGGANFTTVAINDADFNEDKSMRVTYHFGLVTDFSISRSFSIQPHLMVQGKGVAVEHGGHKDKYDFTSLDIPVNFLYKSKGFFIGGGPNLGFNLSGKVKSDDHSEKVEFGSDPGQIRRMNVGANLLTGYRTSSGFFVSANYLADLTNWTNVSAVKWRNNLFGVSIGYMIK